MAAMIKVRYEIADNGAPREDVLTNVISQNLMQGIAYFCLLESGIPMYPGDMTEFLGLTDKAFTERFCEAMVDLAERGLVRIVHDGN